MTYQAPINEGDRLIMTISLFHIFFLCCSDAGDDN